MDFEIIRYPDSRLSTVDLGKTGISKHAIYGLLEIDVTVPRALRGHGSPEDHGRGISQTRGAPIFIALSHRS
jgi:hypothetical protein